MPRRLPAEQMQLRFAVILDEFHYPDHPEEEQFDLVLWAIADGPVAKHHIPNDTNPRKRGPVRLRDSLELRTRVPTSRKAIDDVYKQIDKSVTVAMDLNRFDSEWDIRPEFVDLMIPANVTLRCDSYNRLRVTTAFDDAWPLDFAKEVFKKQLDGPSAVDHCDLRLLQLMFEISPQLAEEFRIFSGAARSELLHPAIDAILGSRKGYFPLGASTGSTVAKRRQDIVRALCRPDTLLNMGDVRALFAKESDNLDHQTGLNVFVPAKHETITALLDGAQVTCIFRGYYIGREITHIALPYAILTRTHERYADLKDELIDNGIDVPDEPVVIH